MTTPLTLHCFHQHDPDGHKPALLLKGDWLVVEISDERYTGRGDASHSRNDALCLQTVQQLFDQHVRHLPITLEAIASLESGPFAHANDFIHATAISAINQALYDLLARKSGMPTWRLFVDKPVRTRVQTYATINRALNDRSDADYRLVVAAAIEQGFNQIKCAPFEHVTPNGDQPRQARIGLDRLAMLRQHWPELSIRIDFHERFNEEGFLAILPEILAFKPAWIEAPLPLGDHYVALRKKVHLPMALGELYFGSPPFLTLAHDQWADIVMPDVKHVGGLGPLIDVARRMPPTMQVSPHNPTGPIATDASLHAAACCPNITSLEIALIRDRAQAWYLPALDHGFLPIPQ